MSERRTESINKMEDHFEQMLGAPLASSDARNRASVPKFIPSDKYIGSKNGYAFKTGDFGLGYYRDDNFKGDNEEVTKVMILVLSNYEHQSCNYLFACINYVEICPKSLDWG